MQNNIRSQFLEGDYLVTEYESGAIIKVLKGDEPKDVIPELPPNPIIELQDKNLVLTKELANEKLKNIEKENIITNLTKEVANIKLEMIGMKGGK